MTSINGPAEPVTEADKRLRDLDAEVESLRGELEQARETNARLNRRCQAAEAAVRDARRCIDRLSEKPWCSGSLGRAVLAYENTLLHEKLQQAEAALTMVRDRIAFYERNGDGRWRHLSSEHAYAQVVKALDNITAWRQP